MSGGPDNARLRFELAGERLRQRRIFEALAAYDEAEQCGFSPDQCASGRWMCWMLLGCFERAWQESRSIAERGAPDPHRLWDGQPFQGKHVMVRCLHGFGDAIQFVRYVPLLRRQAASVTVQTHPRLVSLMRGVQGADKVITWEEAEPSWNQQIEVMELPGAFRTTVRSIPCAVPYLAVEPWRVDLSRKLLGGKERPKVGLAWAAAAWDSSRSLPRDAVTALAQLNGFSFYSLQLGPEAAFCADEMIAARSTEEIADTAADICNLDLVISVDTMLAHLAGALGKPVWTLLPFRADWRWMWDRDDSPWYPTMRLFRQPAAGDWGPVIERVAESLSNLGKYPGQVVSPKEN
jgi:ADP-heptose:LPS heptosyltransferase